MVHIIAYLKQVNIFVSHDQYDGKPVPLLLEIWFVNQNLRMES